MCVDSSFRDLPGKGVLFLGGHQNMVKKLHSIFPGWSYIGDEKLPRIPSIHADVIFYWTGHGSHKMMRFVWKRIPETARIFYVTATNIPALLQQMQTQWRSAEFRGDEINAYR